MKKKTQTPLLGGNCVVVVGTAHDYAVLAHDYAEIGVQEHQKLVRAVYII